MKLLPPAILLFCIMFSSVAATCPTDAEIKKMIISGKQSSQISETCLCSLFVRTPMKNRNAEKLITAIIRYHPITDTLLLCLHKQRIIRENARLMTSVCTAWKERYPSLNIVFDRYRQSGNIHRIDSLYMILDQQRLLNAHQLLQWIDTKKVLDDYRSIPALYCRIITVQPSLTTLALNQLNAIINEIDAQLADSLLTEFSICKFNSSKSESGELFRWILDQFGRKGLYTRQLELLTEKIHPSTQRDTILTEIATAYLKRGAYHPAVKTAGALYRSTGDPNFKHTAAVVLYQSYRSLGMFDSARTWIQHTDIISERDRIDAIEMYHHLKDFKSASTLLIKLPHSLNHDTLRIRHLLMQDSLSGALRYAFDTTTLLHRTPSAALLWRVRTTLFNGKAAQCAALLDSAKLSPSSNNAQELLEYRYWLKRLSSTTEALAKFSQIEYTLFKGDSRHAAKLLCESNPAMDEAWRLAVHIARNQITRSDPDGAVATLTCVPEVHEAEYRYCLAEAYILKGNPEKGRLLLEKLLLEFPGNMYTTKGRLLLSRMK